MKFVLLFGDAAVGKMTVGQELMKLTGLRLFHNHMTIEPVLDVFGEFNARVILKLRKVIFEEFAASENYGMIFTLMWALDCPSDWDYVAEITDIFRSHGAEIYYAELIAPQAVRLERNKSANRLEHKPSKRDLAESDQRLLRDDANWRCVSFEGEIKFENYIRIENSDIPPAKAAEMIRERFKL